MSKELIGLIYKFLVENDSTCAEIFKRGFNPDTTSVDNLPPLENIVEQFINSRKKNLKNANKSSSEAAVNYEEEKIMEIAQKNPSDFLEHIVKKRIEKTENGSSTETDSSEDMPTTLSSSSEENIVSAKKRRKLNSGTKKNEWATNKKSKK